MQITMTCVAELYVFLRFLRIFSAFSRTIYYGIHSVQVPIVYSPILSIEMSNFQLQSEGELVRRIYLS